MGRARAGGVGLAVPNLLPRYNAMQSLGTTWPVPTAVGAGLQFNGISLDGFSVSALDAWLPLSSSGADGASIGFVGVMRQTPAGIESLCSVQPLTAFVVPLIRLYIDATNIYGMSNIGTQVSLSAALPAVGDVFAACWTIRSNTNHEFAYCNLSTGAFSQQTSTTNTGAAVRNADHFIVGNLRIGGSSVSEFCNQIAILAAVWPNPLTARQMREFVTDPFAGIELARNRDRILPGAPARLVRRSFCIIDDRSP